MSETALEYAKKTIKVWQILPEAANDWSLIIVSDWSKEISNFGRVTEKQFKSGLGTSNVARFCQTKQ